MAMAQKRRSRSFDDAFVEATARYVAGLCRSDGAAFVRRARKHGIPIFDAPVGDSAALRLARRRTGLLPLLDAGCALARPDDPLRRWVLLTAAVLETDPAHARRFLPRVRSVPSLAVTILLHGIRAAAFAVLGCALLAFLPKGEAAQ